MNFANFRRKALVLAALLPALVQAEDGFLQAIGKGSAFQLEGQVADKSPKLWTRATVSTNASLSDKLRLDFSGYGVWDNPDQGRYGGPASATTAATHGRQAELTSLNLAWAGQDFSLLAGKGSMAVGVADLQSPTDRFDARDYSHYLHTRRLGRWQLRLDRPLGDDTLTLAVLPFEEADRYPRFSPGNATAAALVASPWSTRRGGAADGGILVKYGAVRDGYDFFAGSHVGPGAYPTLRQTGNLPTQRDVRRPDAASAFAGVVATLDNWRVYGEGLYQHTLHGADQSFLRYTLGTSARLSDLASALGLQDFDPTLEYAGERILRQATDPRVLISSEAIRPYRDTLLAKLRIKPNEDWTITLAASRPLDSAASSRAAGLEYQWSSDLVLLAEAGVRGQPAQGIFGPEVGGRFATFGFDYKF